MADASVSMYDVAAGFVVAFISTDTAELATGVAAMDVVPVKLYPLDASVGVNAATVPESIGNAPTPTSPLPDDPTAVSVRVFWVVPVAVSPTVVAPASSVNGHSSVAPVNRCWWVSHACNVWRCNTASRSDACTRQVARPFDQSGDH